MTHLNNFHARALEEMAQAFGKFATLIRSPAKAQPGAQMEVSRHLDTASQVMMGIVPTAQVERQGQPVRPHISPPPFSKVAMAVLMADVATFMRAGGQTIRPAPAVATAEECILRLKLHQEEVLHELASALVAGDLVEIADAIGDSIYVLLGTALAYGLPLAEVWAEIQRSNLAKIGPDGQVARRADGKVMKPEGWTAPDVAGVVAKAIEAYRVDQL